MSVRLVSRHCLKPHASRDAITSLESYILVIQDEVKPSVELSNVSGALGGGLIGAAIDSSVNDDRSTSARITIEPLFDVTEDVDFRQYIATELNSVLAQLKQSNPKDSAEVIVLEDKEISW